MRQLNKPQDNHEFRKQTQPFQFRPIMEREL